MKIFLRIFFMLLLTGGNLQAQEAVDSLAAQAGNIDDEATLGDTALNRYGITIGDSLREFRNEKAYAYIKYLDSLLRSRKDLAVDTFSVYNNSTPTERTSQKQSHEPAPQSRKMVNIFSLSGVKIALWILAVFVIGLIIWKLFLGENFFRRNKTYPGEGAGEKEVEDLNDPMAYDPLIAQAVKSGNFRLAIRYSYLQTLKKLSNNGLLQYTADKTNYQYVNELRGKPYQQDFAALTLNYEYVWYGSFNIDADVYGRLAGDYRNFNQKV